jgi:phage terminase large subunit-like protein
MGQSMRAALRGRPCFGGLDLSSTTDLASFELAFPNDLGGYDVLSHFWMPRDNILRREQQDHITYELWERQGFLTLTPGNIVDQDAIKQTILRAKRLYGLREIAFDRWNSSKLVTELIDELGPEVMVEFGQGYASMSAPTKELERLLLDGKMRHGAHPVLSWNAANVVVATDAAENRKPVKGQNRRKRIDGIVALVMAVGRAMVAPQEREASWHFLSVE